jgi:hypothetical protein
MLPRHLIAKILFILSPLQLPLKFLKDRRNSETTIAVPILNHMLNLGRPSSVRVT